MPFSRVLAAAVFTAVATSPALAGECWSDAERAYGVSSQLLYAVARAESNLNPTAMNLSHKSRTGTYDIGLMQINSGHLPRLAAAGISERDLYDPCTNIKVGAWLMAHSFARHGVSWDAVGAYNAACSRLKGEACAQARSKYAWRVYRRLPNLSDTKAAPQRPARAACYRCQEQPRFHPFSQGVAMMDRIAGLATSATLTGYVFLTCSSCTAFHGTEAANPSPPQGAESRQRARLVQLAYGREAKFALCAEPACPRVTPKTLASANAPVPVVLRDPVVQPPTATIVKLPENFAWFSQQVQSSEPLTRIVVNFKFASAELTAEAKAAIKDSLQDARRAQSIVISGRTDAVGDLKANEALGLSRALAVRDYFLDTAPDLPATIAIDAKGRCCFVASNANESGRSKNRRVEIVFTPRGGAS